MNIQQHFDIKRFANLFKNDLLLNYKSYILIVTGFIVIYYLFLIFTMTNYTKTFNSRDYTNAFLLGLFAYSLFVGSAFPALSSKNATHTYIMTPASTLEKFSLQFLIRIVFGLFILNASFCVLAHLARATALQMESVRRSGIFIDTFKFTMLYDVYADNIIKFIMYILLLSGGIFLFSIRIFFRKIAVIKSVLVIFISLLTLYSIVVLLSHLFFPLSTYGFNISPYYTFGSEKIIDYEKISWFILLISIFLILPLGYFKLKEKQV